MCIFGVDNMNTAGIVAEFNPFHRGHKYMLDTVRTLLGEDTAIVCAMSGTFVQRGEWAAFTKYARAEAAVRCGADLILELPLPWSMSSAEKFAAGGVELLSATGAVTHICFGSESGNIDALDLASEGLLRPEMDDLISAELKTGVSYAKARQAALHRLTGAGDVISSPNNILAVEYLKALRRTGSRMQPVTIQRRGAGHDEHGADREILSASEVRARLAAGGSAEGLLPQGAAQVFNRELSSGRCFADSAIVETAVLSRLRMLPQEAYEVLPDNSEGLAGRLYAAVNHAATLKDILQQAKTKRYTMSRLRRMLMSAALGIRADDCEGGLPYIKVLALSDRGREVLKSMRESAQLPVVTKPASVRRLDRHAERIFSIEAGAYDLCALSCRHEKDRLPGAEWRSGPFVLTAGGAEESILK